MKNRSGYHRLQSVYIAPVPRLNQLSTNGQSSTDTTSQKEQRLTSKNTRIVHTQYYECDRSGKPKDTGHVQDSERVRTMRGSKRSCCSMTIRVCAVDKAQVQGQWAIVHHKDGSANHNHFPSQDIRIHAAHRQRASVDTTLAPVSSIQALVRSQTSAGVAVDRIHAAIQLTNPGSLVIPKDIANARNAARQEDIARRTPMEALFDELEKRRFFVRYSLNEATGQIRHLFWAHPDTTKFHQQHCNVAILDCTYKTNRYNIPLLNIIAMTGMNTALPVAQCWLPGEKEEDFVWALTVYKEFLLEHNTRLPGVLITDRDQVCMNAIMTTLPDTPFFICKWHMNRNVLAKTREVLESGR